MATVITWNISQLDCLPTSEVGNDYVVTAHWSCVGINGQYNARNYGTCGFSVVEGESFTPYEDLTQEQVLTWCYNNGVDKLATEASVEQQIENQINPPIVSPELPWNS